MAVADWGKLLEQLQGQTKTKIQALDTLQNHVQATALGRDNISSLLDYTPQLLSDNNFKVALKVLKCWQGIVVNSQDVVKPYLQGLLPPVVERLGDNKQDVRQAACDLLLDVLTVLHAHIMMDKLSRFWNHKNWKVRHGLLQFVAEAICSAGEAVLVIPRDDSNWVLHKVIQLVGDPESAVRDASIECLEEVYKVIGEQLMDVLSSHQLRPAHLNLIYNRLAQLGASVEHTPAHSCEASSALDEHDTANSADGGFAEQLDHVDEASSRPQQASSRAVSRQLSSAATAGGQLRHVAPAREESGTFGASKIVSSVAADQTKIKRGGYMDGGGVTKDGGLPPAPTLSVSSERELVGELERIIDALNKGAEVDWEKRVTAMVRLEGLVKGGAAGDYEGCFMEHLRMLKDPLLDQMVDRRSAVARQAAHLFAQLAAALGIKFEPYAITFMGALFKGLVITVQVVSEASEAGAKGILHHCHAPRLVQQVCDILTGDKSAKLRKHVSGLLLQVLEGWEPQEYAHYIDHVEAALSATVQDALGETRTNGRAAFAAYAAVLPDRASALLKRFDSGLQQKLHEAVVAHGKGHAVAPPPKQRTRQPPASKPWKSGGLNGGSAGAAADPEIVIVAGPPPSGSQRTASRPASGRVGSSSGGAQRSAAPSAAPSADGLGVLPAGLASHASAGAAPRHNSRKSVAGVPMRVQAGGPLLGLESSSMMQGDGAGMGGAGVSAAAAAAAVGGRRRTSMMPQRVPYTVHEAAPPARTPAAAAASAAGGYGRSMGGGMSLVGGGGPDALSHHHQMSSMPDSPESYAQSDTSGAGEVGVEHKGAPTRLFQPHPKQLASRQAASSGALSSGGDDLHTQMLLRDQLHAAHHAQQQYAGEPAAQYHIGSGGAQQYHSSTQHHHTMHTERSSSSLSTAMSAAGVALHHHSLIAAQQGANKPATLSKAVAGVLANPKGWQERVDKMTALSEALHRQSDLKAPPEAYTEVEKVVPKLMAAMDDAHFKVSLSALSLLQVCINVCPGVLETSLEKLMPLLFLKLCAGKQSIRSAAEASLQACAVEMDADLLLPALTRSLDSMKQPAARVSVMEFVVLFFGVDKASGIPNSPAHIRQWVSRNIPLLLDKNPNVRDMAGKALTTMYRMHPHMVAACVQHATPQELAVVQRTLTDAEAVAAAEEGAAAAAEYAAAAAAAEHSAAWAQHGQQAYSVSSSADLSQNGFAGAAAPEQHSAAYSSEQQQQQQAYIHQQVTGDGSGQALAANMAGLSLNTVSSALQQTQQQQNNLQYQAAAAEQQQHYQQQQMAQPVMQQQQHYNMPSSTSSSSGAAVGQQQDGQQHQQLYPTSSYQQQQTTSHNMQQAGSSSANGAAQMVQQQATARDVLGRPIPAAVVASSTPGVAAAVSVPPAANTYQQPEQQQQAAGTTTTTAAGAGATTVPPSSPQAAACASAMAAASAVAAGDAGSQARHLTVLVHRLQSRPAEDVLAELAACASVLCGQALEDNFSKVLLAGLSAAQNASESIRELAFLLVLALVRHHSRLFEPVLDVVLQPLLQGCGDESREVLVAAQQALDVLMCEMPPLRCADILAHKLPSEDATSSGTAVDGEVLCATIRCLQLVSRRMGPSKLLSVAPTQLLPGLFAAFHHPRPDVRKAVVFCLVDMWHAGGEGLTPYLASLSTSQLKLLTIYYNRAQSKQTSCLSAQPSEVHL